MPEKSTLTVNHPWVDFKTLDEMRPGNMPVLVSLAWSFLTAVSTAVAHSTYMRDHVL